MPALEHSVALIGKLGHGKTHVLNKVCGTHHASRGGSKSVTRNVEMGISKRHGIFFLGTPGLGPTEDVASHIGAQKIALEFTPLSGVYLVIKCGRDGDMIDDQINDSIDMVGEEMVRIIFTHADIKSKKDGFDEDELKDSISRLVDIDLDKIIVVDLRTDPREIDDFVHRTLLPEPLQIELQTEHIVSLAQRSRASRRISRDIRDIHAKIDAAHGYCRDLAERNKTYQSDVIISDIQQAVASMVRQEKENIFRNAATLSVDHQNICYAQAGVSLSVKVKQFIQRTNSFLSWDATNLSDPRNHYRACNHCGAVYVKVEGCDGDTTCGALPNKRDSSQRGESENFSYFGINWTKEGGTWQIVTRSLGQLWSQTKTTASNTDANRVHRRRNNAVIESGCGNTITWSSMRPVKPDVVAALGHVETMEAGTFEDLSGRRFHTDVQFQEELNKETLRRGLDEVESEGWELVSKKPRSS